MCDFGLTIVDNIPLPKTLHIPTHTLLVVSQMGLPALAVPVHSLSAVHPWMKLGKIDYVYLIKGFELQIKDWVIKNA